MSDTNYVKYRGKCKEFCQELIQSNPDFKLVRGYYYEPLWDREEEHWWCVDGSNEIHDPTRMQYPSGGIKEFYREFDGTLDCAECGKTITESEIVSIGRYAVCSKRCALSLVGL